MPPPGASEPRQGIARLLCRIDEIEDGHSRGFDPLQEGRDTMFVVRRGKQVFGYRNACPHYDFARMAWRRNEFLNGDKTRIICAAHGALFRIEDGVCEIGPCLGQTLTPVLLKIRGDHVWIAGSYGPGLRAQIHKSKIRIDKGSH